MSQNYVTVAERRSELWLSRAKNGDDGHSEQGGEMHRPGVVCEQQPAGAQLVDELFERCLADSINAIVAQRSGDCFTDRRVVFRSEQNPLRRRVRRDRGRGLSEAFGQPVLSRSIFRTGTKTEQWLMVGPSRPGVC